MTARPHRRTTLTTAALAALAVGALLTLTTEPAVAATSPAPVAFQDGTGTVPLDAANVHALCAKVPAAQQRIDALIARIQGGDDVSGSTAALAKRAATARAAGRDVVADRLDERGVRRADRVGGLESLADRLARVEANVCAPLTEQLGTSS